MHTLYIQVGTTTVGTNFLSSRRTHFPIILPVCCTGQFWWITFLGKMKDTSEDKMDQFINLLFSSTILCTYINLEYLKSCISQQVAKYFNKCNEISELLGTLSETSIKKNENMSIVRHAHKINSYVQIKKKQSFVTVNS